MSTLTGTIIIALILCGLALVNLAVTRKPRSRAIELSVHILAAAVGFGLIFVIGFASGVLP